MEEPVEEKITNQEKPETDPVVIEDVSKKENEPIVKTIRTYKMDVANILKNKKTSLTSMVLSERDKKGIKDPQVESWYKNIDFKKVAIGASILLVVGVGFATVNWYNNRDITPIEITELKIPTFIFPNYQREVFINAFRRDSLIEGIKTENLDISIPLGSIMQLFLTTEDKSKQFVVEQTKGNKLLITTESFFETLEVFPPSSLLRALESDFMLGYHSSLGNNPFLLFKVKSYENSFAGMLAWEKTILDNLSFLFKKESSQISVSDKRFKDIVLANKDVRAVLDDKGKIYFAYSFPNKDNLVITNNETTLQEIYRRINTASLERKD